MTPLGGGCLCGHIRYELRTDARDGYFCHCRMCQLAFGSLFAPFLNVRKFELTWVTNLPTFFQSSRIARRSFCPRCGTPLTFSYLDSDRIDISVGSIDEPGQVRPTLHTGVESRVAAWHRPDDLPDERVEDNERIARRWKDAYGADVTPGLAATKGPGGRS